MVAVDTSGRFRLLLAILIAGNTLGCSPQSAMTASPGPTASPYVAPSPRANCIVPLPTSWSQTFASDEVKSPNTVVLDPFAVSTDGNQFFAAQTQLSPSSGATISNSVISFDRQTGQRHTILVMSPKQSILGGDFDGRWVVFSLNSTPNSFGDWRLYAYDVQGNTLLDIARVDTVGGQAIPGPIVIPAVDRGLMAWTQSIPSGETELHLHDLALGTDTKVSTHHPGAPVFSWPWLVWQEPTEGSTSPETLKAYSLDSRRTTPLPKVLSGLGTLLFLSGAPGVLAWTAQDQRSVWVWKSGSSGPQQVFRAAEGDYAEFITLGTDLMTWNGVASQWAGNLGDLTVTQIAPSSGSPKVRGRGLAFSYTTASKGAPSNTRVYLVGTANLTPLPTCS